MRVIAGKYRSRQLASLPGLDLRPTADRLRETLFDILTAGNPAALEGTIWLDICAGTGAVGIEALSRGAAMVYFIESSPAAVRLIQKNLQTLGLNAGFELVQQDAMRALTRLQGLRVVADFIFLDPPYRMEEEYRKILQNLGQAQMLKTNGLVIAEHHKKFDPGEEFGLLRRSRKLIQGDAGLSFYQLT